MTVPDPQRVTPHVRRKGHRLHAEGRACRIPGAFVVLVEGDTLDKEGERVLYAVPCNTDGQPLGCTCPHHGVCGHIIAARNLNATGVVGT